MELLGEDDLNPPQEPTVEEKDFSETNNSQGYELEIPEQVDEIFTISDGKVVFSSINSNYFYLLHCKSLAPPFFYLMGF